VGSQTDEPVDEPADSSNPDSANPASTASSGTTARAKVRALWDQDSATLVVLAVAFVGYSLYLRGHLLAGADQADYEYAAQVIASGWHQIVDRVPLYPLLLIATGSTHGPTMALFLVQLIGHLAAVFLVVRMARQMGVGARLRLALAVLLVMSPVIAWMLAGGNEGMAEFFVVLGAWSFTCWLADRRPRWLLLLGVAAGLAAVGRPTFTLWWLAIGVVVAVASGGTPAARLRTALMAVGPALVLVLLLVGFNTVRFSYPTTTPLLPWNLSTRTAAFVERLPQSDEPARSALINGRDLSLLNGESHSGVVYIWPVRGELPSVTHMQGRELDQYMIRLNAKLIAQHPLSYLTAVATASGTYVLLAQPDTAGGSALGLVWLGVHVVLVMAFAVQATVIGGLVLLRKVQRSTVLVLAFCYMTIAYNWLISTFVEVGIPRHRTPTDALILLVTAVGWSELIRERNQRGPAKTSDELAMSVSDGRRRPTR